MPPDASSRSRTYLPKIWGYTRSSHRTALLVLSLAVGCRTVPGPERAHPIRSHFLPGCPPRSGSAPSIDLQALGDFDPSGDAFETFDDPAVKDVPLLAPPSTRAVVLEATFGAETFHGLGTKGEGDGIDVTLWPDGAACPLSDPGASYPGPGGGQGLGVTGDGRVLLVAGGDGAGAGASALAVDLATGAARPITGSEGPRKARAGATLTAFGPGLLVAGGVDPESSEPLGSADVFDAGAGRFEASLIDLERPRAHHAAVALASGETLLVGGVDATGALLKRLEAVVPETRAYVISGLTDLALPRKDPIALRLSDDRVLVGGGTDRGDAPVDALEWLSSDGKQSERSLALSDPPAPSTGGRALAAMPGGSVLVVGGCALAPLRPCVPCGSGGCASAEVLWVTSDGTPSSLDPLDAPVGDPVLVPGSEGRPFLVDGAPSAAAGAGVVRVFDPFEGRFVVDDTATFSLAGDAAFIAADRGLFLWLDRADGGLVRGYRHGVRGPLSPDVSPLVANDLTGLALDRDPGGLYDGSLRTVTLDGGARLVLTDTSYADVHLSITLLDGVPPSVHLGAQAYGGKACPFPGSSSGAKDPLRVDRSGGAVTLGVGSKSRVCPGPTGRVSVSLEGGATPSRIASITVRRESAP